MYLFANWVTSLLLAYIYGFLIVIENVLTTMLLLWRVLYIVKMLPLFNSLLEISCHRHSVFRLAETSYTKSLWTRYLTNLLWKFHQIYNVGVVQNKDELIRFWRSKVKGQGQWDQMWSKISCSKMHLSNKDIPVDSRCQRPSSLYCYSVKTDQQQDIAPCTHAMYTYTYNAHFLHCTVIGLIWSEGWYFLQANKLVNIILFFSI